MNSFQILMLLASAFFAYKMYAHIQGIDEDAEPLNAQEPEQVVNEPKAEELIAEADKAFMDDDLDKAQEILENVTRSFPQIAEGMNKLAFVLSKQGNNDLAESYYKKSLTLDPNDDMTLNALASLYAEMGKNIQAQEYYKKALAVDENYEITWFNYANLMSSLGEKQEAKEMYEKALKIEPDFDEAKEALEKLNEK